MESLRQLLLVGCGCCRYECRYLHIWRIRGIVDLNEDVKCDREMVWVWCSLLNLSRNSFECDVNRTVVQTSSSFPFCSIVERSGYRFELDFTNLRVSRAFRNQLSSLIDFLLPLCGTLIPLRPPRTGVGRLSLRHLGRQRRTEGDAGVKSPLDRNPRSGSLSPLPLRYSSESRHAVAPFVWCIATARRGRGGGRRSAVPNFLKLGLCRAVRGNWGLSRDDDETEPDMLISELFFRPNVKQYGWAVKLVR